MPKMPARSRVRYCAAGSVLAIAASLAGVPAMAQTAGLEEVVVTARKVAENLQEVPVAVTAYSGADLQRQNAVRITDISRLTPGLYLRQSSTNPSGLLVQMRGQFQRDTVAAQDPSVGTYVDGVYWARSYGLNADLVDLQSVQVLKGPQGTLFGRNTTGGALVLQTNDPQYDRVSGMVSGAFGRFNERVATAVLNVPLVTDKIAIRGAVQVNKRDGYIKDVISGREYDDRDNITGRLKLGIKATDDLSFVFSAEKYRFEQAGQARGMIGALPANDSLSRGLAAVYAAEQGPRGGFNSLQQYIDFVRANHGDLVALTTGANQPRFPLGGGPDSQYNTETYSGTGTWDTGIGTFKGIVAYRAVDGHSRLDLEGSPWAIHTSYGIQDLEQWSGELQLTGKWGDTLDYALGVFSFEEDGYDSNPSVAFVGGTASANAAVRASAAAISVQEAYVINKSTGGYGQVTWHVTDKLNLTGGLRYSSDERGVTLYPRNFSEPSGAFLNCSLAALGAVRISGPNNANVPGDTCTGVSRSADFSNTSYLASADYKLTDDVMVYGRLSKGYRSGGQNLRATSPAIFVPFAPEIVKDAEVGFKSEFFDRRLRLNVAGYRSTIDGAQRSSRVVPPGGGTNINVLGNAASVRVWGAEAEANVLIMEGWRAGASAAYTKPKYLSYTDVTGDRTGERFNGVSEWTASFQTDYERDLGIAQLSLHFDYSWTDEQALDENNSPALPNNALVVANTTAPAGGVANIRGTLSFDEGRYEVSAYGRNIFNNRDLVSSLTVLGFGYFGGQFREPPTWGIQGTYRFGQ